MNQLKHQEYMALALQLAKQGSGMVSPNPIVGCILVKNNGVIGQGWHQRAGGPHAEIVALQEAGSEARDATAYVTLEPCCHQGKTPPCTGALIKAGIKEIYIACLDPNPLVAGKGIEELQANGIKVHLGILEQEATQANKIFFHYIVHKRPFVIAKWAMSLDGKTITHPLDSRKISGVKAHEHAHQIRNHVDAILVGAKTAINDNPQLTARFKSNEAKQPLRIVLASKALLPFDLKLLDGTLPGKTMIATVNAMDSERYQSIANDAVEVIVFPKNKNGQVHLPSLLDELGKREITSLLVEGGMTTHADFFAENLVNKVQVYLSPIIIGSLEKKKKVTGLSLVEIGEDFFLTADCEV